MTKLLLGLVTLQHDDVCRVKLERLLSDHFSREADLNRGRRSAWQVVALAMVKQGLNCSYDRLVDQATHHRLLRQVLDDKDRTFQGSTPSRAPR